MKTVSFDESEWQLVPVEATEEMLEAGFHAIEIGGGVTEQAWAALLAAAPTPAEALADVARDAARYQWLRRENAKPGLGFYVGDDTDTMPGDITWIGSDLDAAIDAAMSEKGGA